MGIFRHFGEENFGMKTLYCSKSLKIVSAFLVSSLGPKCLFTPKLYTTYAQLVQLKYKNNIQIKPISIWSTQITLGRRDNRIYLT